MISNFFVADTEFTPVTSFDEGIPVFSGPAPGQSRVPLPLTAESRSPIGGVKRGYVDSWF